MFKLMGSEKQVWIKEKSGQLRFDCTNLQGICIFQGYLPVLEIDLSSSNVSNKFR